jgi:hypothetical protein
MKQFEGLVEGDGRSFKLFEYNNNSIHNDGKPNVLTNEGLIWDHMNHHIATMAEMFKFNKKRIIQESKILKSNKKIQYNHNVKKQFKKYFEN